MEAEKPKEEKKSSTGGGIYTNTESTVEQYFKYYSKLSNQQNMMQDSVRTGHYYEAIMKNTADFKDKVIMDVGTGSGILSLFAAMAGAKKVYAIEASGVASAAKKLVEKNKFGHIIEVINTRIEDLVAEDEKKNIIGKTVDVIVSEPLGTMLYNERMLETYIIARDKFLKPGGKMFPTEAYLCIAPFYDSAVYSEQLNKTTFWNNNNFYGLDLSIVMEVCGKAGNTISISCGSNPYRKSSDSQ